MGRCQFERCQTHAAYNFDGCNAATFCKQHSAIGMVNIVTNRCLSVACTKRPSFGVVGSKVSVYCKQHAKEGMVNVSSKRCLREACTKRPFFGIAGSKVSVYCKQHAKEGMVDVYNKRCLSDGCAKRPSFGVGGSKASVYCKQHAKEGMVNLYQKRGISCAMQSSFTVEGSKTAAYCKQHAEDGMADVSNKRCSYEACEKRPNSHFADRGTAAYRKQNAEDGKNKGMVDVHYRRCARDTCTGKPTFSVEASETGGYCNHHAEDGEVNSLQKPILAGVRTTGPARGVPTKAADTTGNTGDENVYLDGATKNYRSSSEVVDYRKRSMVEINGVQPPLFDNHSPFNGREACRNTWMDPKKADPYVPPSSAPTMLRDDDTVGTVAWQSSHRLASTLTSSSSNGQPGRCIKTEMEVAVLF